MKIPPAGPSGPKKTLCIVQITRIGDVIQTIQAAAGIKEQCPDLHLIFIGREKFARPLEPVLKKVFDKIFYVDLKSLVMAQTSPNLGQILGRMGRFIEDINRENIQVCLNFSFSKSSSFLCGLIKSRFKSGLYRDQFSQLLVDDRWGQYVYSNVCGGPMNPFHLVDIYRWMLGNTRLLSPPEKHPGPASAKKRIMIHPFSSHPKKNWPLSKWTEVTAALLKNHPDLTISFMGAKNETAAIKTLVSSPLLKNHLPRIQDLTGKTEIADLLTQLQETALFVGHDSMGGHLSSLKNVQTLTLSLGTVRPSETTPYGKGNYNIAPRIHCYPCFPQDPCATLPCHDDITPALVVEMVSQILTTQKVDPLLLREKLEGSSLDRINIYQTSFTSNGEFQLDNLLDHWPNEREVFQTFYHILWNLLLKDQDEILPFPQLTEKTSYSIEFYREGLEKLFELQEFGKKYSQFILKEYLARTPDQKNIQEWSKKIGDIDRLTVVLKKSFPHLAPLIDFYHVKKANLKGQNPQEVTEEAYQTYHEGGLTIKILYELIDRTLKNYRGKTGKSHSRQAHKSQPLDN